MNTTPRKYTTAPIDQEESDMAKEIFSRLVVDIYSRQDKYSLTDGITHSKGTPSYPDVTGELEKLLEQALAFSLASARFFVEGRNCYQWEVEDEDEEGAQ
jgi:hypothetical protein